MLNRKISFILFASVLALCSCNKVEPKVSLYKGQSVDDALRFLGVPEKSMETQLECFEANINTEKYTGSKLIDSEFHDFSEKLINISSSNDYKVLLCNESIKQLNNTPRAQRHFESKKKIIKEKGFPLSLDTTKACVFVRDFKDSDIYAIEELAVLPTHTITTWHYLQSKKEDGEGMLCGYLLYVVKKDSKIKLVSRPPSEVGAKATQKGDDFRRLKGIIDKYCEDKTKELPGTLKKLLSQEKDKEFVERAIVNFFYMGKNKSLEKDAGAIVAYNLHVPKSSYASKKSATAIKLGDENMWFIKEEELPKELRGD